MFPLLLAFLPAASAQDTGDTGPTLPATGETGEPTPTDTGTPIDTAVVICPDCGGAAELVGDEGGSPCQGCASGSQAGVLLIFLPALLVRRLRL